MSTAETQELYGYDGFFETDLQDADPAVFEALNDELKRQNDGIELIASENIVSRAVMQATGSSPARLARPRVKRLSHMSPPPETMAFTSPTPTISMVKAPNSNGSSSRAAMITSTKSATRENMAQEIDSRGRKEDFTSSGQFFVFGRWCRPALYPCFQGPDNSCAITE